MSIFDACIDADIDIVHTRHEGAAVYMAEAYSQLTGNIGVALVTAGAGLGNATGALFSASESDTPLLLISGDSPLSQDSKGAFQELDQVSITTPVTRWSHRVAANEALAADVARAFQLAQSPHPGPVHLAIPVDVLKPASVVAVPELRLQREGADIADIKKIHTALSKAERPLIVTGPSLNKTRQPELVGKLEQFAPVINMESPRGLNDPSLGNLKSVIGEADVIVSLAKRIDFSIGFGNGLTAEWHGVFASERLAVQAAVNLPQQLTHTVIADPIEFVGELNRTETVKCAHADWFGRVEQALHQRIEITGSMQGLSPTELCAEVQVAIDRSTNPVLVCDGGEFGQWAQACVTAPRRVINGLSGSIGGGIGYGIGAAEAVSDSTVFVLTGDGSVGFHLAEIETAVRNNLSLVIIVGNDSRWNAEHQLQIREFGKDRLNACGLSDISYHKTCVALGGAGRHVSTVQALRAALSEEYLSSVLCIDVTLDGRAAPGFV